MHTDFDFLADAVVPDADVFHDETEPLDLTDTLQNVPVLPSRRPLREGRRLVQIREIVPLRIIARR